MTAPKVLMLSDGTLHQACSFESDVGNPALPLGQHCVVSVAICSACFLDQAIPLPANMAKFHRRPQTGMTAAKQLARPAVTSSQRWLTRYACAV